MSNIYSATETSFFPSATETMLLWIKCKFGLLTLQYMPGEFHRQTSLVGYNPWGCKELDTTEASQHVHALCSCFVWRFVFFLSENNTPIIRLTSELIFIKSILKHSSSSKRNYERELHVNFIKCHIYYIKDVFQIVMPIKACHSYLFMHLSLHKE